MFTDKRQPNRTHPQRKIAGYGKPNATKAKISASNCSSPSSKKLQGPATPSETSATETNVVSHNTSFIAPQSKSSETPTYRMFHEQSFYNTPKTSTYGNDAFIRESETKQFLHRPLGGLEIMYHHNTSKGMDIICLMTKLATTFPVTHAMTKSALFLLAQKHPMLRMTIQNNSGEFSFLEMERMRLDFAVSERTDWLHFIMEEADRPLDTEHGPLWKCRLLLQPSTRPSETNPIDAAQGTTQETKVVAHIPQNDNCVQTTNGFVNESTFLFVWHHSIMDGKYVFWIFKQFVEILDNINSGINVSIGISEKLPLLPPMEDVMVYPLPQAQKKMTARSVYVCLNPPNVSLHDYNHRFYHEIQMCKSGPARNGCVIFEFSEQETKQIMRLCKAESVSANGVFLTAGLLAFVDLVYSQSPCKNFKIPFEFMMDLRRFCPLSFPQDLMKYFPGVASVHVPMIADIQLSSRPATKQEFWEMSRSFGSAIQSEVHSPETFSWIRKIVNENLTVRKPDKPNVKSPRVLLMSNMGSLEGVFTGDIATRVKLAALHAHSTTLIEDSPIFFVSNYILNSQLYVTVSFCKNYTSVKTATEYLALFKKNIMSQSKL